MQLGIEDCCLRNKIKILAMYLDSLPRLFSGSCVEDADVTTISLHINELLGYPNWPTIDGSDIVTYTTINGIPVATSDPLEFAWNTTIGLAATNIVFDQSLGTSGSTWGMSYIIYNALGQEVGYTISNRTKDGFTIVATEDNVHFEGTAIQIV
jgi:hypothetical protein